MSGWQLLAVKRAASEAVFADLHFSPAWWGIMYTCGVVAACAHDHVAVSLTHAHNCYSALQKTKSTPHVPWIQMEPVWLLLVEHVRCEAEKAYLVELVRVFRLKHFSLSKVLVWHRGKAVYLWLEDQILAPAFHTHLTECPWARLWTPHCSWWLQAGTMYGNAAVIRVWTCVCVGIWVYKGLNQGRKGVRQLYTIY